MTLPDRAGWEITAFFAIWLLTVLHAAVLPAARVWAQQCWLFAVLCLLLPFINLLTTGEHFIHYALQRQWPEFSVELGAIIFGLLALWLSRYLKRRSKVNDRSALAMETG
ncbi:MAG: PepSY domain-containing protein, partial [Methylophaga sp.]